MKKCSKCGQVKQPEDFPRNRRVCKPCTAEYKKSWKENNPTKTREYKLLKVFGITHSQYEEMHSNQNGVCAICFQPESAIMYGETMNLAVDHDHATGEIRGLLCGNCNNGLGRFKDDIGLLQQAILYIEKARPEGRANPI
jgi:hypothetical protein